MNIQIRQPLWARNFKNETFCTVFEICIDFLTEICYYIIICYGEGLNYEKRNCQD